MPRYEFAEGGSSKFWEITLEGTSFKTTYGKIGAAGQTTVKSFKSEADAKKEADKITAEKVKKGYQLVGGGAAPAAAAPAPVAKKKAAAAAEPVTHAVKFTADARNPEIEKALIADPTNRQAFAMLGDWLQEQGDPRGELISLQLGNKDKQAKALIEKHADYFLGPLAPHQKVHDEGHNNSISHLRTKEQ